MTTTVILSLRQTKSCVPSEVVYTRIQKKNKKKNFT